MQDRDGPTDDDRLDPGATNSWAWKHWNGSDWTNTCQEWLQLRRHALKKEATVVTRKHRRFVVSMPSILVQRDQFRHKGSIRDLSAKGCRVESLITPFTGMQVTLLLHIPGEAVPLKIENAAVRWCGSQGIGMEFLVVAEPEQARLGRYIQQLEKTAPAN